MVTLSAFTLIIANLASKGSATSLFLTTQRYFEAGKVVSASDLVDVYDKNAVNLCSLDNDKLTAMCYVKPKANSTLQCTANYNGTQPWKQVDGLFQSKSTVVVEAGSLTVLRKDGTKRAFNVTTDKACKKYECHINYSDARNSSLHHDGFTCQY